MASKDSDNGDNDDDGWGPWPDADDEVLDADEVTSGSAGSDRVERGVEALQAAARELIKAARAVLDVAEEVVQDPDAVVNAFGTFTTMARGAMRSEWPVPGAARSKRSGGDGVDSDDDDPDDVQHIPVD